MGGGVGIREKEREERKMVILSGFISQLSLRKEDKDSVAIGS